MKVLRTVRFSGLLIILAALILAAVSGFSAPLTGTGHTGQALALRSALRSLAAQEDRAPAGSREDALNLRHTASGRYVPELRRLQPGQVFASAGDTRLSKLRYKGHAGASASNGPVQIDEAVQTFDVFNPPPGFTPTSGLSLTAANVEPVWTADESYLLFSSNRSSTGVTAGDGRYHIWAIPVNGGTPLQVTTSQPQAGETAGIPHGEFFPALSAGNNQVLAFTSDVNSPNVQNLYHVAFSLQSLIAAPTPVDVSTLTSDTIRTDAAAVAAGGTGFGAVGRPSISPANSNLIVFSAFSTDGTYLNHSHLYFLYLTTGGFDPNNSSLPAKLTDGPADDTDPSFSADGQLIAFASTAVSLSSTGESFGSDPNTAPIKNGDPATNPPKANRSIFALGGGGATVSGVATGFGVLTNGGAPVTSATVPGSSPTVTTDDFAPSWSSLNPNPYTNAAPGAEYIAFSRGASASSPHDIYYLQVLQNTSAGGESGKSNEAATTPLPANTPVYQVAAGRVSPTNGPDPLPLDPNYPNVNYTGDVILINNQNHPLFNGGQSDPGAGKTNPPVNTINDPGTPPSLYNNDRSGTFTYILPNLTPDAVYTVRLHFADPKDTMPGQRVFNVLLPGTSLNDDGTAHLQTNSVDIVAAAQTAPGDLGGLVTDSVTGNPVAGATITVNDANTGQPISTSPAPLTTSGTATSPTAPGGDGSPLNYLGSLQGGTDTVTVSAPGYASQSRTLTIGSSTFARADFTLSQTSGTLGGNVTDATTASSVAGAVVTVTDAVTGATIATTPTPLTTTTGTTSSPPPNGDGSPVNYVSPVQTGTFYVQISAPGYGTTTQKVTVTAGAFTRADFALSTNIGYVGGLITDSVSKAALAGATVTIAGAGNVQVASFVTPTGTSSPLAGVSGDGNPLNYDIPLVAGAYTLTVTKPNYTPITAPITITAAKFTRSDAALVSKTATAGGNTAVVEQFQTRVPVTNTVDKNGLVIIPAGAVTIQFMPGTGDPPIVQGIEVLSDSAAQTSSGIGEISGTSASVAPLSLIAIGGDGQVSLIAYFPYGSQLPASYNLYRSFSASSINTPNSGAGTEGNTPYLTNAPYTTTTDPGTGDTIINFQPDTTVSDGNEYYYQVTGVYQEALTPESASNNAVHLNTDDNPGETSVSGNLYDDTYPTWSPFRSIFSIAYQSNRSVTYNAPTTAVPSETAISVPQGSTLGGALTVGANYSGILESQVLNLDPPTLVPYSGNEIVHVQDANGNTTRTGITPGQAATFVVRLSSREAGIDNTGGPGPNGASTGGPNVYIQIKDPDSKYQDAQGLEHKVFAKDDAYRQQSNNPGGFNYDSGSSDFLINGGGYTGLFDPVFGLGSITGYAGFNAIGSPAQYPRQRGSIGGIDGPANDVNGPLTPAVNGFNNASDTISVGRDGGGGNPVTTDDTGKPFVDANGNQVTLPGGDPALFIPWGPEYECQVVNPQFGVGGATDTATTDYANPYYLAGVDDQQPFSGAFNKRPATEWLQLTQLPAAQQDNQGGVLYSATWTTPTSPSDYYLDVIAFDKAQAPSVAIAGSGFVQGNWRIYDNVWGFSTQSSIGNNDILVVSDYALGQKFAATTFGGTSGLLNLVPKLYGAESYATDVDINILPDAVYTNATIGGRKNPVSEVLDTDTGYDPALGPGEKYNPVGFSVDRVLNGLGVGSFDDSFIDDGGQVDGVPDVKSQKYSIWRVLSRGPVPPSLFQAYEPTFVTQPAVTDPAKVIATAVPAGKVTIATRCIVWVSPFTGDLLVGAGSLTDANTQANLRAFVAAGGRLCVSGQNVVSSLTQNGTVNNGAGGFVSDVLNATLAAPNAGTHIPVGGASVISNRITLTPFFDGRILRQLEEITPGGLLTTVPVGSRPIRISNNYGGNIFGYNFLPNPADWGNWRTDGSLDQLGPYIAPFTDQGYSFFYRRTDHQNAVVDEINTVTPVNGALTDITMGPYMNDIPPLDYGDDAAASEPGGIGLILHDDPITATSTGVLPNGGTGSRIVFSSFGLEALGTEYYTQTVTFAGEPAVKVWEPRNQRQHILHNIVNYLRTGTISGTVRATSGSGQAGPGVPNVTVFLVPAYAPTIPGRGTFSALTDTNGNYRIDGIEPGNYTVASYKTGYNRTVTNPGVVLTIEGDASQTANLTISPTISGSISGIVTDNASTPNPVQGAVVTLTSTDGQTTVPSGLTDAGGHYSIANVPSGTYTGVASKAGYTSSASQAITITANANTVANFVLTAGQATLTGRVYNTAIGDTAAGGIAGAIVTLSTGSPATVAASATTQADGTYTLTATAGTYSLTASATGFGTSAPVSVTLAATTNAPQDIGLAAVTVANGTVGGIVTSSTDNTPIGGVTLTVVNTATGAAVPTTPSPLVSTSTTTSPTAPNGDGSPINYSVSLPPGSYTLTATRAGSTPVSVSVTVQSGAFSRADFTGAAGLPPLHTFAAGLNFLSAPYDYSMMSFDALFGPLNTAAAGTTPTPGANRTHVAVWNPLLNQYALDPVAPADALHLGIGYWVYLKNPTSLTQQGVSPTGSTVSVTLHPAWNQIGVPSTSPIPVSSLTFNGGNAGFLSFAQASSSAYHIVSPTLYRYDGVSYQPVLATDSLQPWQAYWIMVYVDTTVRIPTGP